MASTDDKGSDNKGADDKDTKQNIAITKGLAAEIRKLGVMGETYEDVLWRLVRLANSSKDVE